MSNFKHTPVPWEIIIPEQAPEFFIVKSDNFEAAYIGKNKQIAERIVKAVNCHEELVEALNLLNLQLEEHFKKGGKVLMPSQIELAYLNGLNAIKKATE